MHFSQNLVYRQSTKAAVETRKMSFITNVCLTTIKLWNWGQRGLFVVTRVSKVTKKELETAFDDQKPNCQNILLDILWNLSQQRAWWCNSTLDKIFLNIIAHKEASRDCAKAINTKRHLSRIPWWKINM